jgi:uncharacterized protein with PIN domain
MHYKEMDPALALKAIEGFENVLEPEAKAQEAFYRQFRCKRCGGQCRKEMVRGHVFSDPQTMVPRSCLRCPSCDILYDPHSDLVVEGPKLGSG